MHEVTEDVFCVPGTAVNRVLVRDGRDLTVVDAGYPGDAASLADAVRALGSRLEDVRAVLVTHAHVDHVGGLSALAPGTPVLVHPDELPNARGERREQATPLDVAVRAWRPRVARWALSIVRAGATAHPVVAAARPFPGGGPDAGTGGGPGGGPLDLPGGPVPVPTPGHTSGHTAYLFPRHGVVATGDALVTGHPTSRVRGPQLLPGFFTASPDRARDSLGALAALPADLLVPGHGDPWRGDLTEAVARARR
ncbi:MBL fold metallo-hydrolase [Geodermatophilus sp. SYSU D00684]